MSNHFPALPDLLLASVTYTAQVVNTGQNWPSAGFTVDGVTTSNVTFASDQQQTAIFSVTFEFATPGAAGSFDQDAVEAQVTSVLNDLAQAVATTGGISLAAVQSLTAVYRNWAWTDSSGAYRVTWQDTMTYPPA